MFVEKESHNEEVSPATGDSPGFAIERSTSNGSTVSNVSVDTALEKYFQENSYLGASASRKCIVPAIDEDKGEEGVGKIFYSEEAEEAEDAEDAEEVVSNEGTELDEEKTIEELAFETGEGLLVSVKKNDKKSHRHGAKNKIKK